MALPILDGNQSATTLSTILTGGAHIPAHTVVSLGSQAITDITSAVSGVTIAGTVTANLGISPIYDDGGDALKINIAAYDGNGSPQGVNDSNGLPVKVVGGSVTVGANPSGALTTRFGSVATANLATLTSAVTNASRKYLLVQNIATGTVTIGIGFAPTTTQGIQLTAGAGLTFDAFCPTGGVWWLSGVTSSNFCVIEG